MSDNRMFAPLDPDETAHASAPTEDDDWQPMPAPNGAAPNFRHRDLGEPSQKWEYIDAGGALEGYICRFEVTAPDGNATKEFRPRRYGRRAFR